MAFSSANSINWGRLLPQIVYYISAYCDVIAEKGETDGINVVVPTGNFGNILAAYYAKKMGVPIKKLICASNSNNQTPRCLRPQPQLLHHHFTVNGYSYFVQSGAPYL